eukprot:EG_transcript_2543
MLDALPGHGQHAPYLLPGRSPVAPKHTGWAVALGLAAAVLLTAAAITGITGTGLPRGGDAQELVLQPGSPVSGTAAHTETQVFFRGPTRSLAVGIPLQHRATSGRKTDEASLEAETQSTTSPSDGWIGAAVCSAIALLLYTMQQRASSFPNLISASQAPKRFSLVAMSEAATASATEQTLSGANPFLNYHGVQAVEVVPAVRHLLGALRAEFEALEGQPNPGFATLYQPLRSLRHRVDRLWQQLGHLLAVAGSAELATAALEVAGDVVALSLTLQQSPRLQSALRDTLASPQLSDGQRQEVEACVLQNDLAGASLPTNERLARQALAQQLAILTLQKTVLCTVPSAFWVVTDSKLLQGLPDPFLSAVQSGNQWRIPVNDYAYSVVMRSATEQAARRQFYALYAAHVEAAAARIDADVARLRRELAAGGAAGADLLPGTGLEAKPAGGRLASQPALTAAASARKASFEPWDEPFWSAAAARDRHGVPEAEQRRYFRLPAVWAALAALARAAAQVSITPLPTSSSSAWHPTVTPHELRDAAGRMAARLYLDPYARLAQKGAAGWTVTRVSGPLPGDPDSISLVGSLLDDGMTGPDVEGLFTALGAVLMAGVGVAPAQWQAQRPTLLAAAPAQPLPPALLAELRAAGPRPPLAPDFYAENPLDRLALGLFRQLVQREIGYVSAEPGYAGLIDEARHYMIYGKATKEEQQAMVVRVLSTLAGPAVPPIYQTFMAPWPWAPFLTAFFTPPFFKFLVGPNRLDVRNDGTWGGVYVERCRFLEETGCKGLCLNLCKLPTQTFFQDVLGLQMTMNPDFDTHECRLSFGLAPPPLEEDPKVPYGCLNGCTMGAALKQELLAPTVFCSNK